MKNEHPHCPTAARLPCWHTASPSGHCLWLTGARCQNCQYRPFNFPVIVLLLLTSPSIIFCGRGKRVSQMFCSSQFYQAGRWLVSKQPWFVVCRQVEIYTSHCLFIFPRWLVECGGESFINFQSETFFHPGLFSHCLVRGKNSAQLSATKELHQLK